ncbi:energy-coupling factor transporter ATPase [Staphylococcus saccharolyticus]|uniref:energy-coupling factor transporter ATPase n=1 Tax=Staphylococcus saccharolyticus TaxID=33028 RepID=UPI00102D68A9|nr:energy-coupling factor transporter ATPase [Staphylococcus saccharolyticus]MBL7573534.1 energy-coupling factor transporter ATPase [Staphylococcus saccharolyticus]MBL7584675.1 energy-coupling factor transporter ATPase [Staphylococcus saccharolyticus]MBL7639536.1 energy-coupling factor transporter ATPase [Staphylococcus saccharolyticus]QRJ68848.1 energy-coupling factor transporter ATPase [Staphylococcus saccharolyticus]TAA92172.1 energy-coupling factor transporter ATPase [Staphylococcus saccha
MKELSNIIEFQNVSFQYQSDAAFTLNQVSFTVPLGQWTSIVGHNGSGKSTIAKLIVGVEEASEGKILFKGNTVDSSNQHEVRKHIGIVFQNPDNQFVASIVKFDVAFGLENHQVPHDEMINIVDTVLSEVDMLDKADYEPQSLSGGQKQRVAIAGVLALNPDMIILDEATTMLDPKGKIALLNLVKEVKDKNDVTIVSITHDLDEVMDADNVIVMNKGSVFKQGRPQEIFKYADELTAIGLDLPFPLKINQLLGLDSSFVSYERLLKLL